MELGADDGNHLRRGRLMATVTSVYAIDYVAEILNEEADLLRAIIRNDDNLTYGNIVSVMTGDDDSIPALTDDGIEELRQMLTDARRSAKNWQEFLDCFVDDEEVVARVKSTHPRRAALLRSEANWMLCLYGRRYRQCENRGFNDREAAAS